MRTSSTFSILFWMYTQRSKNGRAPLYARISIDSKKRNLSLKRRVDINLWDHRKQRLKGTHIKTRQINQYLDEVHSSLFQCYREIRADEKRLTPQAIKSRFLGEDRKRPYTLKDIFAYHNSKMFPKLQYNTSRLYLTSQKYIMLFIKKEYRADDMDLSELNFQFILNFEKFLRTHKPRHYQQRIGNNAAMKHIQRLRKMVTLAYHMEWIDHNPFRKFKQRLTPTHRGFLTAEELKVLEELSLDSIRLRTVRDLFLFSCYTGISYTDLMLLSGKCLVTGIDKTPWLVTQRQKTNNPVKIPLLAKALTLIERYKDDMRVKIEETLFPRISNQKMNAYLKEVAKLAEIQKNLTFHMARHTFATTVTLSNGVPLETISKMLGHSKLTTTQIYARVLEQKVSEDMQKLREKLEAAVEISTD